MANPKNNNISFRIKLFTAALVGALFAGSAVYAWQRTLVDAAKRETTTAKHALETTQSDVTAQLAAKDAELQAAKTSTATATTESLCAYDATKLTNFRKATSYDLFGGEAFDTVVCGYMTTADQESFGTTAHVAYFHIVEAAPGLATSIKSAIDDNQNAINRHDGDSLEFRIGCVQQDALVFDQGVTKPDKIGADTEKAFFSSTKDQPINLEFSFEKTSQPQQVTCNSLASHILLIH